MECITISFMIDPGSLIKKEIRQVLESMQVKVEREENGYWSVSTNKPIDLFRLGENLKNKLLEKQGLLDRSPIETKSGNLYLSPAHICFDKGHSMYSVYTFHNHQSSYGQNKCSRCGHEEDWQYDYVGSNPMYINH